MTNTLTLKKLERFVKTRNKSGFRSNLQFNWDASACGISIDEFGDPEKFVLDGFTGYRWKPVMKTGETVTMVEFGRTIYLDRNIDKDKDTKSMFELMDRLANFVEITT
jgi:hypothetical protein